MVDMQAGPKEELCVGGAAGWEVDFGGGRRREVATAVEWPRPILKGSCDHGRMNRICASGRMSDCIDSAR